MKAKTINSCKQKLESALLDNNTHTRNQKIRYVLAYLLFELEMLKARGTAIKISKELKQ